MSLAFHRRAVYHPDAAALVVADLHAGRGPDSAVDLPLGERADLGARLSDLLDTTDPATVVVAGDVVHAHDGVSIEARRTLEDLDAACAEAGADLVLVAGNHDAGLAEWWDGSVTDGYRIDAETVVCHGHERPGLDGERYLVGHDHPTVDVEGERHPCFLRGPAAGGGELVMLPAFNRLAPGVAVGGMRGADFESPLVGDADALRPHVYDDDRGEVLSFPRLGALREHL